MIYCMKEKHAIIKAKKEKVRVELERVKAINQDKISMKKGPISFDNFNCNSCENRAVIFFPCSHTYCNNHEFPISDRKKLCMICCKAVDFEGSKQKFD